MSLFDFFFPQQATASHLRAIREQQFDTMYQQRKTARSQDADAERLAKRLTNVENDLGFLTLLLAGLLDVLDERGTIRREDVKKQLERLDVADGMRDGRLSIQDLKESLG